MHEPTNGRGVEGCFQAAGGARLGDRVGNGNVACEREPLHHCLSAKERSSCAA